MIHASESQCSNGGCTRPTYRGKYCFRCWAGVKWTSIVQRIENKTGHCRAYEGLPLGFTRETLIQWVLDNPPPEDMQWPSIDRIKPELGYAPGNIRWIERNKNVKGPNRDLPYGLRGCSRCKLVKPEDNVNFPRTVKRGRKTYSSMCLECNRVYQSNWRETRRGGARI
jgi:hypothetical protein